MKKLYVFVIVLACVSVLRAQDASFKINVIGGATFAQTNNRMIDLEKSLEGVVDQSISYVASGFKNDRIPTVEAQYTNIERGGTKPRVGVEARAEVYGMALKAKVMNGKYSKYMTTLAYEIGGDVAPLYLISRVWEPDNDVWNFIAHSIRIGYSYNYDSSLQYIPFDGTPTTFTTMPVSLDMRYKAFSFVFEYGINSKSKSYLAATVAYALTFKSL